MKRRFVQDRKTLEFHEVGADYAPDSGRASDAALWGDRHYDGMRATDGADIGSRSKHRAYMRANGLTTVDDFKQTWRDAAMDRERIAAGHDPARKADIARAIAELEQKRRR